MILRVAPLVAIIAAIVTYYGVASQINDDIKIGEDLVCGVWGAIWQKPASISVAGIREDVAIFCSGDPAIGSTPLATLEDVWAKVQAIRAAQVSP